MRKNSTLLFTYEQILDSSETSVDDLTAELDEMEILLGTLWIDPPEELVDNIVCTLKR
jgi:hypothetical protein